MSPFRKCLSLPAACLATLTPAVAADPADYTSKSDWGVMGPPATPAIVAAALENVKEPMPHGPFEGTWESIEMHYRTPDWFEDAKFGVFLHWGLYAVPAHRNEWYQKHMYAADAEWHAKTFGPQETFGYKDFIPKFTCQHYDPVAWAALFRKAGARYVIPTAQHHDNFPLWDSALTRIDAKDLGPHRDLIGDLAKAVRNEGLKFGVSNHGIENFTFIHPAAPLRDRLKEKKADLFDPAWQDIYHYADRSDAALTRFLTDWVDRNLELIDKYQPDLLWFDNGVNAAKDRVLDPLKTRVAAHYYNRARDWNKDVAISTKGLAYAPSGDDSKQIGSIIDFEKIGQRSPPDIRPGPWQVDHPIGSTWGYTSDMRVTKGESVIPLLIDTVSKGGNLLLNLSPMADGTIPQAQQDSLLTIGRWLEVNGEAIYGTRPWKQFGEEKIRFTTKGNTLYAISLSKPGRQLSIKALATTSGQVTRVEQLGESKPLNFTQTDQALNIDLPTDLTDSPAWAFRISRSGH